MKILFLPFGHIGLISSTQHDVTQCFGDLNAISDGKIAKLCVRIKSTIFIVGISNFGIVYFKHSIFILRGKKFRFIGTLIEETHLFSRGVCGLFWGGRRWGEAEWRKGTKWKKYCILESFLCDFDIKNRTWRMKNEECIQLFKSILTQFYTRPSSLYSDNIVSFLTFFHHHCKEMWMFLWICFLNLTWIAASSTSGISITQNWPFFNGIVFRFFR